PPGGDPGSGLWLGSRFLSLSAAKRKGLSRRDRAAYARKALERAEAGDRAALVLVRLAQDRLAGLLSEAAAGRRSRGPFRVALAGGLMQNDFFRRGFVRLARELLSPVRISIAPLRCTAETAAAGMAARRRQGCGK
ncbi:MAG TPA: hypothetical protein PL037_08625, partial [Elusimicrobiales bacterium]|nr:hypothetical protein [Elusimicrobiales bacterium]